MRRTSRHDRDHKMYVSRPIGERVLWQAVLGRQIRDAFGTSSGQKRKAIAWLFSEAHKENRNKVCDMANINFDSWSGQIMKFLTSMDGCDYILVDGHKINGRECGKYICKMLARSGND